MFHKLRLKLTIINLVIIAALFLILTIGTYFFAEKQMQHRSENMGPPHGPWNREGPPPRGEHQPPDHPLIFYVKTDASNQIFFASSSQPLEPTPLSALVQETLYKTEEVGTIFSQESFYFYLKVPLQDRPGMIILFQNFDREKSLLRSLITALIIIGLLCLLLSLVGSLYMANRAMIPIVTAWEQQKDFLADVSHELRTPLTVMQTNLEIVFDNPTDTIASQSKWLHNIKEESDAMAKLVNSLLFLARADSQQPLLEKKTFSLSQAIIRSTESFTPLATAKGITLHLSISPNIYLQGDEGAIKQLVGILFDNSIRHTPSGGKISLSLSQSKKEIIFIFKDTGEGMEINHLEKIFDRFYQIDKSRFKGGTGLGLAIAKLIVETQGGSIKVNSQPALGTEFIVTMPILHI